jgi:hypothetical protein
MSVQIAAIETHYHGYRFRSRLEARWAVFFDAAGIEYVYEPEGYVLGGRSYLPDFWLPRLRTFVEVKPTMAAAAGTKPLLQTLVSATDHTDRWGLLLVGPPNTFEPPRIVGVDRHRWWDPVDWMQCPYCNTVYCAIPHAPRCNCLPRGRVLICSVGTTPRVDYAMEAGQQARFEHGEDPTPDLYLAAVSKKPCRVYVAGAVIEEQRVADAESNVTVCPLVLPWRHEIFGLDEDSSLKAGGPATGRFRYGGPTIFCNHGTGDHELASRCMQELEDCDLLFAWIDRTDTVGTLVEIGAAHVLNTPRFVAFAGEALADHFYFVRQLSSAAVVVPTAVEAWSVFERWRNRVDAA